MQIVRKDERRITTSGAAELRVEHLSSTQNVRMSIVEFPPGAMIGDAPMRMKDRRSMSSLKGPFTRSKGKTEPNLPRVIPLAGMPAPPFRQKYGSGHRDCANLHLHRKRKWTGCPLNIQKPVLWPDRQSAGFIHIFTISPAAASPQIAGSLPPLRRSAIRRGRPSG